MPATPDTYSVAEAAQILGVGERRVRQLVASGELPARREASGGMRLLRQPVNEERRRRRAARGGERPAGPQAKRAARRATRQPELDVDELATAVATAVGRRIEGQLEITMRAESLIRQELDEERAKRMEAEARAHEAEERLADAQARLEDALRRVDALEAAAARRARHSLFRRQKGSGPPP